MPANTIANTTTQLQFVTSYNDHVTLTNSMETVVGSIPAIGSIAVVANNFAVIRGGNTGQEGGHLVLGYSNNTTTTITGQANNTWNMDVDATNQLRVFSISSANVWNTVLTVNTSGFLIANQPANTVSNTTVVTAGWVNNQGYLSVANAAVGYLPLTNPIANGTITSSGSTIATNNVVVRGGGSSAEGGQIVLGYANNLASSITGQANNTWNLDVDTTNNFRFFSLSNSGVANNVFTVNPSTTIADFTRVPTVGGVSLMSTGGGIFTGSVTGTTFLASSYSANNGSYAFYETNSAGVQGQLSSNGGGSVEIKAVSNHPLIFYTNNVAQARLLTNGNLGIGISPTEKLHVSGNILATGTITTAGTITTTGTGLNGALRLNNPTGARDWRVMQRDDSRFSITDETAGAERLSINNTGAVTIPGTLSVNGVNITGGISQAEFNSLQSTVSLLALQTLVSGRALGDEQIIDSYTDLTGIDTANSAGIVQISGRLAMGTTPTSRYAYDPLPTADNNLANPNTRARFSGHQLPFAGTWVRVRVSGSNNGVTEQVQLHARAESLISNGTVLGSGVGTNTGSPPAAWRDNAVNVNASGSFNTWYGVDFGAGTPRTLNQVLILGAPDRATNTNSGLGGGNLEGSNDNTNWTSLCAIGNVIPDIGKRNWRLALSVTSPASYRWYRWNLTNSPNDSSCFLSEVFYIESGAAAPSMTTAQQQFTGTAIPLLFSGASTISIDGVAASRWTDWALVPRVGREDLLVSCRSAVTASTGYVSFSTDAAAVHSGQYYQAWQKDTAVNESGVQNVSGYTSTHESGSRLITGIEVVDTAAGVITRTPTNQSTGGGWNTYFDFRTLIPSAEINTSLTRFRIRIRAGSGGQTINDLFIGNRATSGNTWDFAATPTRVTFNGGSNTATLSAHQYIWSDFIVFSPIASRDIIIAVKTNGESDTGALNVTTAFADGNNWRCWYSPTGNRGGETSSLTPTGYTEYTATRRSVSVIGVEQSTNTSDLTVISTNVTADAVPTTATVGLLIAPNGGSIVPGTNLRTWVSRNGGTNETEITLSPLQTTVNGLVYYQGTGNISGQPSGSNVRVRYLSAINQPQFDAMTCFWKA